MAMFLGEMWILQWPCSLVRWKVRTQAVVVLVGIPSPADNTVCPTTQDSPVAPANRLAMPGEHTQNGLIGGCPYTESRIVSYCEWLYVLDVTIMRIEILHQLLLHFLF